MARVVIDPAGMARIEVATGGVIERITEDVAADAILICPVRSGDLKRSIEPELVDVRHGRVVARKEYAAAVECGHRKVLWGRVTDEFVPAQPFLRPALFRVRNGP